jgi:hypothetical protein
MEWGMVRKKRLLEILCGIGLTVCFGSNAWAGQAVLSWNSNSESDLAGYKVYYSTLSGSYTNVVDVGLTATPDSPGYTVTNLTDGATYYFAVTAYDQSLNQSGFSKETWLTVSSSGSGTTTTDTSTTSDNPTLPNDGGTSSLNSIPVADAGMNQIVETASLVTLNGSMSYDENGDPLTFHWSQTGGTPITLDGMDTGEPKFYPVDTGTYTFELVVDDGLGQSLPSEVKIFVMDQILTRQTVEPQSGGTLSISSGDLSGVQLNIPAGAVENEMEIAIGLDFSLPPLNGRKQIGEAASFEPAGTHFQSPASVEFPVDFDQYPNLKGLKAYLYDEPTGKWNEVAIVDIDQENGFITAQIDHFSSFALALGDTGGPSNSSISGGFGCGAIIPVDGKGGNPPPSADFILLVTALLLAPLRKAIHSLCRLIRPAAGKIKRPCFIDDGDGTEPMDRWNPFATAPLKCTRNKLILDWLGVFAWEGL